MSDKVYNLLFVCTGNSARSILAEDLLNSIGRGQFVAHSVGSHPTGTVNPFALQTLQTLQARTAGTPLTTNVPILCAALVDRDHGMRQRCGRNLPGLFRWHRWPAGERASRLPRCVERRRR